MKNFKNKKTLQIVLLVVIAVVTLGIGYAAISAVNLIINGNATASVDQNNFKVHFTQAQSITGTAGVSGTSSIDSGDDTKAMFDVTGLTKVGDYAEAVYTVRNDSNGIGAEITLNLTNSNSEYFKVTETILDNKLQAREETTAKVRVEMIKTPITDSVSTTITATLTASPLEDAEATGGEEKTKVKPGTFAGDSWEMIAENVRNNTTDDYKVGDTKKVTINGTDYTVRIANKSTAANCSDVNYSQTACGFVVEFVDIIEKRAMNSERTNVGGWPGSELHTYLEGEFYNSLPSDLKDVIKSTRVISGYGNNGVDSSNFISNDKLYLFSEKEIFNYNHYDHDKAADFTNQLDYYKSFDDSNINFYTIKKYDGNNEMWWLRACFVTNVQFSYIQEDGVWSFDYNSHEELGLSPAFRIG